MTIVRRIAALLVSLLICVVQPAAAQTTPFPFPVHTPPSPIISGNGRYVVYEFNGVWLYDRHTTQHERADVSSAGTPGSISGDCSAVSGSGRFVAFNSIAYNLVTGDSNDVADVFVRDRQTGQTTRENFHAGGAQVTMDITSCPTISDDGRYVVFGTRESLVVADTNGNQDVYVRDRSLATTAIVSVSSTGQVVSGLDGGLYPRLSANGRFVTWISTAAGALVPGSTSGLWDVFVRDLQTSQTTLVSRSTAGVQGNSLSWFPAISGDGRYVAFFSAATNLVSGDAGGFWDVFVHDRETGETTMASVSSTGAQANGQSGDFDAYVPLLSISYDGRYVAFQSVATNLVPSDTNLAEDIFVRDLGTQATYRATLKGDQSEAMPCSTGGAGFSREPVLSGSGIDMTLMTILPLSGCSAGIHYVRRVWSASSGDFDLDRRTDITVFRPSNSTWLTRFPATAGSAAVKWGSTDDIPAAADFDGDGRTDYAVFRPSAGVWYWLHSWTNGSSYGYRQWGATGDVPVPGDYDGDGKADPAVFRPITGTWFAKLSGGVFPTDFLFQFGANGDVPVPADYDGDRKMDIAVYRPSAGVWFIRYSSTGAVVIRQWGISTDITVPGDYDGDERADLAVYRPSQGVWYIAKSSTSFATYDAIQWGVGADVPVAADYNGDGRMDPAVFRPGNSTWWVYNQFALFWGTAGDIPIGGRQN